MGDIKRVIYWDPLETCFVTLHQVNSLLEYIELKRGGNIDAEKVPDKFKLKKLPRNWM